MIYPAVVFFPIVVLAIFGCAAAYRAEIEAKKRLNGCPYHAPVMGVVLPARGRMHLGCVVCEDDA